MNDSIVSRRDFLRYTAASGLAASLFANWGCSPAGGPKPPNVLLVSLSTTRADHLGAYGYPRPTTPALDALANQGLRYARAISTSNWTLPAHASMFTGKFVTTHGARRHDQGKITLQGPASDAFHAYRALAIGEDQRLLPEMLRDAGYATGAVAAGPWLNPRVGLHRGFDHYDGASDGGTNGYTKFLGGDVTVRALEWLGAIGSKPFFLFVNYVDPHTPYALPDGFSSPLDGTPDPGLHHRDTLEYDQALRVMDDAVGQLLDGLKREGRYDNTVIIAMGDHGRLFRDGEPAGHGSTLYQGEIHVPLIVRYPNGDVAPGVREELIQPVDVLPLILNRLDLPFPDDLQGSHPELISHPILAEAYPDESESPAGQWLCLIEGGRKLLFNSRGNHELYDLDADPRERQNLASADPDLLNEMLAKLLTHFEALPRPEHAPPPLSLDAGALEELEAMGYL